MHKSNAARMGQEMAEFFQADNRNMREGQPHHNTKRIQGAIFDAASELIPDDATWARIERDGDHKPIIVALEDQQLYFLEVINDDQRAERPDLEPPTRCRMLWVEPGAGSVEVRLTHRVASTTAAPRSAEWSFVLRDGTTLTIPTYVDEDGEYQRTESFARALCTALGFQVDFGREPRVVRITAA